MPFRFPHNKDQFRKWLDVLSLDKNTPWTKYRVVCSDHFNKEDFVPAGDIRRLKPNVVPSLKPRATELVFVDDNLPFLNQELERFPNVSCDNSAIGKMATEEEYPAVKLEYIEPVFVDVNQHFSEEQLELPLDAYCDGDTIGKPIREDEEDSICKTLPSDINSTSDLIRSVQLDHQYL